MATLGNNKITGLDGDQVTSNDHVVTRGYSDGVLPSPQENSGGLLKKLIQYVVMEIYLLAPSRLPYLGHIKIYF